MPAPANGGAGAANPMGGAGMMPAMVMPMGQPGNAVSTPTPEGGGASPNANVPGNQAPSESRANPSLPMMPSITPQTTKPRQMPSGGGGGMDQVTDQSPDQGSQNTNGGADMMDGPSSPPNAYSSKLIAVLRDIRRDNPHMPEGQAMKLAYRVSRMPGVVASDNGDDPMMQSAEEHQQPLGDSGDPSSGNSGQGSGATSEDDNENSSDQSSNEHSGDAESAENAEQAASEGQGAAATEAGEGAAGAGEAAAGAASGAEGLAELLPLLAL